MSTFPLVAIGTEDPLFQSTTVPALPFIERLRTPAGRRAVGLGLALLIEVLLIIALLTLVSGIGGPEKERPSEVTLNVHDVTEEQPQERRPEPQRPAESRPETQPQHAEQPTPPQPAPPAPVPPVTAAPTPIIPMQWSLAPSAPRAPPAAAPLYGPPVRHSMFPDTERVGTAPNGEALYAAAWYREPDHHMLGSYLSTAQGPGWGLIACRTAPDYRVEDCVPLEESPAGSNINRSILAAAWEFRVRPPRRGGEVLVGSWVRIRIDYDFDRH